MNRKIIPHCDSFSNRNVFWNKDTIESNDFTSFLNNDIKYFRQKEMNGELELKELKKKDNSDALQYVFVLLSDISNMRDHLYNFQTIGMLNVENNRYKLFSLSDDNSWVNLKFGRLYNVSMDDIYVKIYGNFDVHSNSVTIFVHNLVNLGSFKNAVENEQILYKIHYFKDRWFKQKAT